MKKSHALLLSLLLGVAAAQSASVTTTTAQVSSASADPQLNRTSVTLDVGSYVGPLSALLNAVAKAAGYGLVVDGNVDTPAATPNAAATTAVPKAAVFAFKDKPFNEVWPLLMDVYGLSYEVIQVGSQPVIRVSSNLVQRVIKLNNIDAETATQQVKLSFGKPSYKTTTTKDEKTGVETTVKTIEDIQLDSPTLRIVADVRTNSIVVRGTSREVVDVERAIKQVDSESSKSTDENSRKIYTVLGSVPDTINLLRSQYPLLKVVPVGQTSQIIISGDNRSLNSALLLLGQVDKAVPVPAAVQTVQKVFQLVNASAEEVKATLEGTLAKEVTPTQQLVNVPVNAVDANGNATSVTVPNPNLSAAASADKTSAASSVSKDPNTATIIADKRTNTLIVRGTPTQVAQVAELIPQLDQVVPQINVQVRIQEVSETALNALGMNWRASFGGFNVSVGGDGLAASFDPTRSLMGFNVFPTLTAMENQGMTRRVYDGNVTMQSGQRALANASGGASNSSSNAAANIKSGGRLEITIPSASGNIVRQIDYGVNLDFYDPQVAPDGTITLRIRGQVNNLKTAVTSTTIPNLLDFSNSEAQSTITFKSGQTVLMSGLLGTSETTTKNGVPVLSSIPLIGAAFGKQSTNRTQTQLLVIVTGNVVK